MDRYIPNRQSLVFTYLGTCLFGALLCISGYMISPFLFSENIFIDPIPKGVLNIFLHNIKLLPILLIPLFNWSYYVFCFSLIFISLGVSFQQFGIIQTLIILPHLPIELFAFCYCLTQKKIIPSIIFLFVAAIMEYYAYVFFIA